MPDPERMADVSSAPQQATRQSPSLFNSVRFKIAALLFFGLLMIYMQRAVMAVAIIPMGKAFQYGATIKGSVMSSFFAGYICTNMIGGGASTKFGGWRVLLGGFVGSSLATLLCVPFGGFLPGLLLARFLLGASQGLIYPSIHALASKWAPRNERATLIGAVWSGGFLGPAVSLPLAGALVSSSLYLPLYGHVDTEWPSVFYVAGVGGLAWAVAWYYLGASSPSVHGGISAEEKAYILDNTDSSPPVSISAVPWARVLRHPAVIALVIGHATHNWTLYLVLSWLPTYLHAALGYDLRNSGTMAIMPYLFCFLCSISAGAVGDHYIKTGVPVATVRKVAMTVSEVIPAVALVGATYVGSPASAVTLLTIAIGLSGVCSAGFAANHLDIAPQYAGLLLGLSNTCATIPGIIGPTVVGAIIEGKTGDVAKWRLAFGLSAGISMLGWLAFVLLARGTRQSELDVDPRVVSGASADSVGEEEAGGAQGSNGPSDASSEGMSPPTSPQLQPQPTVKGDGKVVHRHAPGAASNGASAWRALAESSDRDQDSLADAEAKELLA